MGWCEMAWHDACGIVSRYVVKVETPEGAGTGFFFAWNADRSIVAVATALHVVRHAQEWRQPIRITQENNQAFLQWNERVVLPDYQTDSAAILIRAENLQKQGIIVPDAMLPLMDSTQYKKVGVTLSWGGYPAIAPTTLCFFQGTVSAFNESDSSYFIDGVAINGVSGGPVFDEWFSEQDELGGQLVGIVSAYFVNRQRGETLPGLLVVHDVSHLNATIQRIRDLDDARKKEAEAQEEKKTREAVEGTVPKGPLEPTK